jgi:hypothetical protein
MQVIAIDPGNEKSALVIWDGQRIVNKLHAPNAGVIYQLRQWVNEAPCVIEMIGHYGSGMPAGQTVFDTCVWIGRFMEAYGAHRCTLMKRGVVKMHLCGSMRAKDPHIRQALIDRFGAPGTKGAQGVTYGVSKDLWSALAVAVAWHDQHAVRAGAKITVESI